MSPIVLIGIGAFILAAGLGLGYWFGHAMRMREAAKVSDIAAELKNYRSDVTEHFTQTAAHFQSIGEQYQALYEHMAMGAQALCDAPQPGRALPFSPDALAAPPNDYGNDDLKVVDNTEVTPPPAADTAAGSDVDEAPAAEQAGSGDAGAASPPEDTVPENEAIQATPENKRIYH